MLFIRREVANIKWDIFWYFNLQKKYFLKMLPLVWLVSQYWYFWQMTNLAWSHHICSLPSVCWLPSSSAQPLAPWPSAVQKALVFVTPSRPPTSWLQASALAIAGPLFCLFEKRTTAINSCRVDNWRRNSWHKHSHNFCFQMDIYNTVFLTFRENDYRLSIYIVNIIARRMRV